MKPIQSMKWIAFLALATAAVAAQDGSLLRRELKVGSSETYKIQNQFKQLVESPIGEMDLIVTTEATVDMKTTNVNAEKGTAEVDTTTKVEKFQMDGSIATQMGATETKLPEPKKEKGTLDARNRFMVVADPKAKANTGGGATAMLGMQGADSVGAMSLLTLIELPEKPVKLGDSIDVALPGAAGAASMGVKDLKMTMKLVGEKEVDGKAVWVVSYSGDLKLDMDPSKLPQGQGAGAGMKITGTGKITGEGLVDKATGKTISNTMTVTNETKVFVEQLGSEIPTKGSMVMKLSLVK